MGDVCYSANCKMIKKTTKKLNQEILIEVNKTKGDKKRIWKKNQKKVPNTKIKMKQNLNKCNASEILNIGKRSIYR